MEENFTFRPELLLLLSPFYVAKTVTQESHTNERRSVCNSMLPQESTFTI